MANGFVKYLCCCNY